MIDDYGNEVEVGDTIVFAVYGYVNKRTVVGFTPSGKPKYNGNEDRPGQKYCLNWCRNNVIVIEKKKV